MVCSLKSFIALAENYLFGIVVPVSRLVISIVHLDYIGVCNEYFLIKNKPCLYDLNIF
jgi:hypothetical protein